MFKRYLPILLHDEGYTYKVSPPTSSVIFGDMAAGIQFSSSVQGNQIVGDSTSVVGTFNLNALQNISKFGESVLGIEFTGLHTETISRIGQSALSFNLDTEGTAHKDIWQDAALTIAVHQEAQPTFVRIGEADLQGNISLVGDGLTSILGELSTSIEVNQAVTASKSIIKDVSLEINHDIQLSPTFVRTGEVSLSLDVGLNAGIFVEIIGTAVLGAEISISSTGTKSLTGIASLPIEYGMSSYGNKIVSCTPNIYLDFSLGGHVTQRLSGASSLNLVTSLLAEAVDYSSVTDTHLFILNIDRNLQRDLSVRRTFT